MSSDAALTNKNAEITQPFAQSLKNFAWVDQDIRGLFIKKFYFRINIINRHFLTVDIEFNDLRQIKKGFILVDILAIRDQAMEDLRDTSGLPKVLLKLTGS